MPNPLLFRSEKEYDEAVKAEQDEQSRKNLAAYDEATRCRARVWSKFLDACIRSHDWNLGDLTCRRCGESAAMYSLAASLPGERWDLDIHTCPGVDVEN